MNNYKNVNLQLGPGHRGVLVMPRAVLVIVIELEIVITIVHVTLR